MVKIIKVKLIFVFLIICIIYLFLISRPILSIENTSSIDDIVLKCDEQLSKRFIRIIPGAVVVFIENGEIYYQQAFGYKDRNRREIMSVDTIFQVGSLSKTLTAFGIMKLVEDEIINLYSPVTNYITQWTFPNSEYDINKVTTRRLLNHTAGMSVHGYWGYSPRIELPTTIQSLSGTMEPFYNKTSVSLINEPGRKWEYSGGGYTVLQLMVEEITSIDFSDYINNAIFEKMGMTNSFFTYPVSKSTQLAKPYNYVYQTKNFLFAEKAAAGLYTTSGDLADFIIEVIKSYNGEKNDLIIDRNTLLTMLSDPIGLGLFINPLDNGIRTYGHGGSNRGWKAHFEINFNTKDGIIILTNGDWGLSKIINPLISAWRTYEANK